jgi:predicted SPOUT superfamily RNA methylase MTH1
MCHFEGRKFDARVTVDVWDVTLREASSVGKVLKFWGFELEVVSELGEV